MAERDAGRPSRVPMLVRTVATVLAASLPVSLPAGPALAQSTSHPSARSAATVDPGNSESLTVTGHRQHFESAPVPGPPMPPPPDKPPVHLGRYKISGDQEQHDGIDAQTGAQIGAFGTAYTNAGPVSQGLAAQHPN